MKLLSVSLLVLASASRLQAQEPVVINQKFDPAPEHLAMVDFDAEPGREILMVRGGRVFFEKADEKLYSIALPGTASAWTVADHDGDGREDLLVLEDGSQLVRLLLVDGKMQWSAPLVENLRGSLPRGIRPGRFARDLNKDGRADLAVPDGSRLRVYFGSADGFVEGPDLGVVSRLRVDSDQQKGLMGRVSREIFVPQIQMRDLNGDAEPDLQVSEALEIRQYISVDGVLPSEPSVTVDLQEFQDKLPELKFDPSNVAGLARYAVFEEWSDLNMDGALDLIILWGGNVLIYLGGPDGVELRRPFDQLPTRGNVIYAFAAQVDDDDVPDLVLIRIEDISLAKALSWIVFSASLDVDILAYRGIGNGRFDRRPLEMSKTVTLDLPALKDLTDAKSEADQLRRTIVRIADFDADGQENDLVVLSEHGQLSAWSNVIRDPEVLNQVTQQFLSELLRGGKVVEVDVKTLTGWLFGRASLLMSLAQGQKPMFELPQPPGWVVPHAMTVVDLDGDGGDEILMLRRTLPVTLPDGTAVGPRLVGRVVDVESGD